MSFCPSCGSFDAKRMDANASTGYPMAHEEAYIIKCKNEDCEGKYVVIPQ